MLHILITVNLLLPPHISEGTLSCQVELHVHGMRTHNRPRESGGWGTPMHLTTGLAVVPTHWPARPQDTKPSLGGLGADRETGLLSSVWNQRCFRRKMQS